MCIGDLIQGDLIQPIHYLCRSLQHWIHSIMVLHMQAKKFLEAK